jgi:cytochrome b561
LADRFEAHILVTVHEPLGIAIFIFVLVRIGWRQTHTPPPFPPGMGPLDRLAAMYSERLLYALPLCQPLIGWAMVPAPGQPMVLFGSLHLPAIAPENGTLFANLLRAHIVTAYLLYLTFAVHLAGVLLHTIVIRNGVLDRMAFWGTPRSSRVAADGQQSVPSSRNSAPGSEREGLVAEHRGLAPNMRRSIR